jgi:probable addiction module antidote protein
MPKARPFDAAKYRDDPRAIAKYLNEAQSTGDPVRITKAIGDMVRAQGVTRFAQKVGRRRESLYGMFRGKTSPAFDTVINVLLALDIQLVANPSGALPSNPPPLTQKRKLTPRTSPDAYRNDPKMIAKCISDALTRDDPAFIKSAIGTIARAHGMGAIAKRADVNRAGLYRSLRGDMDPAFRTVLKVLAALGVRLMAEPRRRWKR